uniref:Cytochrome c oxidase subunit 2 n=1 Tax=Scolytus schevyrewi TaxID=1158787 RepID=A0A6G6C8W7_9CUCU|nr:cytochrome c oxidase subunit 2 [Scolytus schevyrewi]QID77586.1 cytochrome c oxidase subunit 2 [Scolytus schevyrewi]
MCTWKTLMLQDSASPLMEQLTFFHDHAMMILIVITVLVGQILVSMLFNKFSNRFLLEGQTIELIWTILPAIILIMIALPSLRLLYIMDEMLAPMITIKIMGHQWYWSYEYSDFKSIEFDSYMIPQTSNNHTFRLLDVDNRMTVPFNTPTRIIVSSADVIHSWAVPSLGIKIDATPGRLNQSHFNISRTGLFFGQCSEICGTNHSFMPIVIESVSPKSFIKLINKLD